MNNKLQLFLYNITISKYCSYYYLSSSILIIKFFCFMPLYFRDYRILMQYDNLVQNSIY